MSEVICKVVGVYADVHTDDLVSIRCHVTAVKIDCEDLWLELRPVEDFEGVVSRATLHFGLIPKEVDFPPTRVDSEHDFVLLQKIKIVDVSTVVVT